MNTYLYPVIGFIIILFMSGNGFSQETVDIPAAKDNTLYEDTDGELSNGAGSHIFAGNNNNNLARRALLAFDITGHVPDGATILEVSLTLNMSRTISGSEEVSLYKMLADWGEGESDAPGEEGAGTAATADDATWLHQFYDEELWDSNGGDYEESPSATASVGSAGPYTWGSNPDMVADVQEWLDNPDNNYGWILIGNESAAATAKRFDSRENSNPDYQPLLTVMYEPVSGLQEQLASKGLVLKPNYPNPFYSYTTFAYELMQAEYITLTVYNARGQQVVVLLDQRVGAGEHTLTWKATNGAGQKIEAGMYYAILQAGDRASVHKIMVTDK